MWAVDLSSAVLITALELGALLLFWFMESFEMWAASLECPTGSTARFYLAVTVGPAVSPGIEFGFCRAGLLAVAISQAPVTVLLVAGLAAEFTREVTHGIVRRRRVSRIERGRRSTD